MRSFKEALKKCGVKSDIFPYFQIQKDLLSCKWIMVLPLKLNPNTEGVPAPQLSERGGGWFSPPPLVNAVLKAQTSWNFVCDLTWVVSERFHDQKRTIMCQAPGWVQDPKNQKFQEFWNSEQLCEVQGAGERSGHHGRRRLHVLILHLHQDSHSQGGNTPLSFQVFPGRVWRISGTFDYFLECPSSVSGNSSLKLLTHKSWEIIHNKMK